MLSREDQKAFVDLFRQDQKKKIQQNQQKWYAGEQPTGAEALARIYTIGQTDSERGRKLYDQFRQLQNDSTSPFYNPYRQATSRAARELTALGVDTSGGINDDFFKKNSKLQKYYNLGTNGTPVSPGKNASNEEKAAYWYYQAYQDEENTKKAEKEWEDLRKAIYSAANSSRPGATDDEILSKIDMSKYKTLAKMDEGKSIGAPMSLNRGIGYSKDALNGVLWAIRNGGGTGDSEKDSIYAVMGKGNSAQTLEDEWKQWVEENRAPLAITSDRVFDTGKKFRQPGVMQSIQAMQPDNPLTGKNIDYELNGKKYTRHVPGMIDQINAAEQYYQDQGKEEEKQRKAELDSMYKWEIKPIGRYGKGNIDLYNRPTVQNEDGTISTLYSFSFNEDGKEILIPSVIRDEDGKGRIVSEEEAIDHYHKTGEYLGKFNTVAEADKYADKLHKQGEYIYFWRNGELAPDYQRKQEEPVSFMQASLEQNKAKNEADHNARLKAWAEKQKAYSQAFESAKANGQSEGVSAAVASIMTGAGAGAGNTAPVTAPSAKDIRDNTHAANYLRNSGIFDNGDDKWLWSDKKIASDIKALQDKKAEYQHWAGIVDQAADQDLYSRLKAYFMGGALRGAKSGQDLSDRDPDDAVSGAIYDAMHGEGAWASIIKEPTEEDAIASLQEQRMQEDPWATNDIQLARSGQGYHLMSVDPLAVEQEYSRLYREWEAKFDSAYDEAQGYYDILFNTQDPDKAFESIKGYNHNAVNQLIMGGDNQFDQEIRNLEKVQKEWGDISRMESEAPQDANAQYIPENDIAQAVKVPGGIFAGRELMAGNQVDIIYHQLHTKRLPEERLGESMNLSDSFDLSYFVAPEQEATFNKYYNSGKKAEAMAYWEAIQPSLQWQKTQYQVEMMNYRATQPDGWKESAYSLLLGNSLSGAAGLVSSFVNVLNEIGITDVPQTSDYRSAWFNPTATDRAARSARGEVWGDWASDVAKKWLGDSPETEQLAKDFGQKLYGVAMSIGDNISNMVKSGGMAAKGTAELQTVSTILTQLSMSSSVSAQTLLEDLEDWKSPIESALHSIASGAIEAITEKYSIEAFFADPSLLGAHWLSKYIGQNMLAEGSEEVASNILNLVEDSIRSRIFGHDSNVKAEYDAELARVGDEKKALANVIGMHIGEIAEDFIGGAVSGGILSGGGAIIDAVSNPGITKSDIGHVVSNNDQVQSLIELGMASKDGRVQLNAKKMSEKIREGKKLSFRELGRLYTNISETESERTTAAVTESVQNTVKTRLHEIYDGREGISTGDISDMAEAVAVAVINPDQLTRRQQTLLKEHAAAGQLVNDMSAEAEMDVSNPNYQIVQDAFKAAEKAGAEGRKNSVRLQDILYRQNSPEAAAQSAVQTARTADAETVQLARQATGERTATMRDVVIDGRIGEVAGFKDGNFFVNVKAEDGSTVKRNVSYSDLEAVDPKMAAVANYVETYQTGLSDSYKSRLINGIGAYNGDAISYLTETRNATIAGWIASDIGKTVDHISGTGNQELINSFYTEAKNDYEADEREWLKQAQEYKFKANNTIRINGVSRDDAEAWDTAIGELAQDQRDQINIINALADGVGMNVEYVSRDDLPNMYGSYNDGTMTINLKGQDRTSKGQILHSMLAAAGHEMTHHFKFTAPKAYKAMRQYMLNYLHDSGTDVVDMVRRLWDNNNAFIGKNNGERSNSYSLSDAIDEVMANGADQVMTNEKFINKLKQDNPSLFGKMQNFVQNFLNKIGGGLRGMNARSASYTARQFREVQDEIAEKWHVALQETIQNRQAQFSGNAEDAAPGTVAEAVVEATDKETGYVNDRMAEAASEAVDENGNQLFSVASMEHDKQKYRQMLVNTGLMKQSEIDELFDIIDSAISVINEDGNRDILDLNEDYGPEGRAFNPVKPNSDSLYKVSLDFSTLCRKRLLQQILQEKIEKKYNTVMTKAERVALRNALKELQAEGKRIEIACALCYVESARLKSPAQIIKFLNDKRGKIIDYLSKNDAEYKGKIQDAVDEMTKKLGYPVGTPMSQMSRKDKKAIQDMKRKMYEEYKPTLNESREIEAAMTMDESYFKTASGLAQLKKDHPMVFDAYTTFVRNATKSKGLEGDVPFYAGDTDTISDSLIQSMNAENGLRSQSWSDFQVYHMLDYIGAIIELSTRNAKMQAYTKVADYVKLMGRTGQMINLSLIPTDYDGKTLGYDPKEGMDYITMQELRDEFPDTVGNICIGISDDHIRALLASDDIDYVIPYHKSSMDKATRAKIGLKNWSEYEAYQNETNRDYNTTDRYAEDYHRHTKFSDWYNLDEARKSYEKHLNELTKNGKVKATVALKWQASNLAMRDMADNYIELCHRRGLQEKFAQFSDEDGYWKLLIDRKMINQKTGELIEQKAVQPVFNKDDILEILHNEVKRVREIQPDMDYVVDNVLNRYGEIRKAAGTKAVQQEVKAYDESIVLRNIVESAKDMDAAPMRGTAAAASSAPMTLGNVQGEEVAYAPKKQQARYADEETKLSISDREYMDAVNSGDMDAAQRMVDQAAKEAGYTVKAYHGTNVKDITVFDTSAKKSKPTSWQLLFGTHFTMNPEYAEVYAGKAAGSTGTARTSKGRKGRVYDSYLNTGKMLDIAKASIFRAGDEGYNLYYDFPADIRKKVERRRPGVVKETSQKEIEMGMAPGIMVSSGAIEEALQAMSPKEAQKFLVDHGYDSVKYNAVYGAGMSRFQVDPSIIMLNPEQIKSADPVTYDDDGNVIPLSERFNTENDDIRYSISDPDPVQEFMMNLDEKQGKTPTEARVIREYHAAVQALSEAQAHADEIRQQLKPRKGFNSFGDEARKLRVNLQTANGRVDRLQSELNKITSRKSFVGIVERSEDLISQISGKTQEEINEIIQDLKSKVSKEKSADRVRELEQQIRDLESEATKRVIAEQQKWRQVIARDKAAREQRTENARKRAQIGRMVNKLNDLIYKESDKKNIPEEMKPLAKTLVKIFLANDEGNRTKLAFDDKKKIKALKKFYDALDARDKSVMKFDDPDVEDAVNEALNNIRSGIKGLYAEKKGTERLQAVSEALDKIRENTNALYRMIQAQRTVWIKHKAIDLGRAAYMVVEGAEKRNPKGDLTGTLGKGLNSIGRFAFWGNMTPVYFFKNLHNEGMDLLNDAVKDGENRNGLLIQEFRDKIAAIADECGYATWDLDEKHSIKLDNGETVSLTTEQIMSLVATATREATFGPESSSHLENGGFVYEEQADKMLLGRKVQEQISHRVTKNDIDAITELLTREQQAYMHKMVALMSKDAARYGNEASQQMYGIKKFNEEYYFPFAVWDGVKNKASDAGAQTGMPDINRIAHQGFTKRRVNNAQNAILLRGFTDTVVEHLNAMINYSTMAQAIETMNRVLGYKIGENADAEDRATVRNVESIFREKYGMNAANYLRKYMKDLNGGAARNQTKSPQERLLTLFRKNAVAGSLSVALQQPMSYIRAANQISTKYLAEALNPKYYRGSMDEMLKHSGVAVIKHMGRFDMNYGRSGVEYMMPEAKKSKGRAAYDWISDKSTVLPELMDDATWTRMWTACKLEQMELHPELTGEDLMSATAARFNELIRNTQVYDSVVVRSQNMREQNLGFKILTSFMAEPTLTANLLADAWANRKGKDGKKGLISAVMLFLLSAAAQAGIKGVIGAGRTPDEKKTLAENMAYKFAYNFIGEVNPLSLIPGYDDIVTTLSGGDIKDDSFSAVTKLVDAAVKMVNPDTYNKSGTELYRGFEDGIGQVAQIFSGVPLKNLMRDGRAMYNYFLGSYADRGEKARASSWPVVKYQTIDTIMQQDLIGAINKRLKESGGGYGTSNTDYYKRIYEARKTGNGNAADEMAEYLTLGKGVTEDALASGISTAAKKDSDTSSAEKADFMYGNGLTDETDYITKEFKAGNLTEKEASDLYKKYFPDMSDNDIYWKIDGLKYQMTHDNSKLGYSMYQSVMDAVETNKADKITAAVNDAVSHGLKTENIAKEISNKFKPIYLAASASEKVKLKDALTKAYKACGLTADQAIKRINGWKAK